MVAQASGMDWWWNKGMPQGVHQGNGGESSYITIVPGIGPLGHAGGSLRLNIDNTQNHNTVNLPTKIQNLDRFWKLVFATWKNVTI